ncbi:hypothetical protein PQE74_gp041 [Bacillus phage vB_BanS_Chewbecca]|uniref:Uncharacterized protein n=1 Tax=Bacillus phage vB_BanS_Chewbecca TaxID=2894786 RepID=A0AAE8YMN2_9CAUD|nr:hypothetical protein PQE74_gp041 [Bacillus phage vB_BanS_Chewbecca]UGO46124.1 hypothetical protein CHEWBECCA_41 [Bacillus phage vB_BanS_Chewbecca]
MKIIYRSDCMSKRKLYKVEAFEHEELIEVEKSLNKNIDDWQAWETDVKLSTNAITGKYYYVMKIYQD